MGMSAGLQNPNLAGSNPVTSAKIDLCPVDAERVDWIDGGDLGCKRAGSSRSATI